MSWDNDTFGGGMHQTNHYACPDNPGNDYNSNNDFHNLAEGSREDYNPVRGACYNCGEEG